MRPQMPVPRPCSGNGESHPSVATISVQEGGREPRLRSIERKNSMQQALAGDRSSFGGVTSLIADHARAFASGSASSSSLTDECLARISDPAREGKRTFV